METATRKKTVITREYPAVWDENNEPYYPINDEKNNDLYSKYRQLADTDRNVAFGGRLGLYSYFDMDKTIEKALELAQKELSAQ